MDVTTMIDTSTFSLHSEVMYEALNKHSLRSGKIDQIQTEGLTRIYTIQGLHFTEQQLLEWNPYPLPTHFAQFPVGAEVIRAIVKQKPSIGKITKARWCQTEGEWMYLVEWHDGSSPPDPTHEFSYRYLWLLEDVLSPAYRKKEDVFISKSGPTYANWRESIWRKGASQNDINPTCA